MHGADGTASAAFIVWDSEDAGDGRFPFRATMRWNPPEGWAVFSLLPQCTGCFGTGLTHDRGPEICDSCGGGGWGYLESKEHRITVTELAQAS